MTRGALNIDDEAVLTYVEIIRRLRSARLAAGLTQNELTRRLPVSVSSISEWETGNTGPTLNHLTLLTRELDLRLTIIGLDGKPCNGPSRQRPGESWVHFERRRLAWPLRVRRVALKMSQEHVGQRVGVSRDSISRWETAAFPPQLIALVVWAQKLGYSVGLRHVRGK
jgi:transcriptional regulator with XRE-family HTH domain